jgi:type VI secretion system protein ImpA
VRKRRDWKVVVPERLEEFMAGLEQFLEPISADNPSGVDLRLVAGDVVLRSLDELRREANPALDPGGETKHADWRGAIDLCEKTLREKTKDLQIAGIYAQALTRQQGFPGLADGLNLLRSLLENFWTTLHPGNDAGEIIEAIRARPLSWVGTSRDFLTAVKMVPLSAPIGEAPRSWFDYEQAQRVDKASTRSDQVEFKELIELGLITTDAWLASLGATPPERLTATLASLQDCRTALDGLSTLCEEKFADSPPYFLDLKRLLEEIQEFLMSFTRGGATTADAGEFPAETPGTGAAAATVGAASATAGPVANRDDAYRRLREVAEFLRKTEPHSPVPALLDRAVRWGNMTFENLFDDVVKNADVRNQTKEMLGLAKPQS